MASVFLAARGLGRLSSQGSPRAIVLCVCGKVNIALTLFHRDATLRFRYTNARAASPWTLRPIYCWPVVLPALRRRAWPRLTSLAGAWSFVPHSLKKTFYNQKSQTQMPAGAEHITKMTEGKQIWTLGDCKEHVLRGHLLSAAVSGQLWEGVLDKVNRGSSKAEFSWEI